MIIKISDNDITDLESKQFAILDVSATWCGPCKMIAPLLERISEEYDGKVAFYNADSEENPALTRRLKVMSIPNVIFFKNGTETSRLVGAKNYDDYKEWIDSNTK